MRWVSAILPAVAVATLALAGCAGPALQDCPAGRRCLRAGNLSDPGSLDPAHAFVKQDQTVIDDLLVGLTTFDAHGAIVPGMARSWTTSADGLTWRFRLRDARWSDGAPVTAQDVLFTYRRLVTPATGSAYAVLLYPVVNAEAINKGTAPPAALGVSAPDAQTVEIRLVHPTPYLPTLVGHYGVMIVPEHAVRRWGEHWTAPGRFVSNGPYLLAGWRLGDRITLVRNPRFYDAAHVCLDRVEYLPTTDTIAAERQVRRGELQLTAPFSNNRARWLQSPRSGLAAYVHMSPWTDVNYVVFRLGDPLLRDERVRQALTMAIDRDFIARRLLRSGQVPADAFTPPGIGALPAAPDWALLPLAERQARARRLLAQAGFGPRRPLRLEMKTTTTAGILPVAIQADWRVVGVELSLTQEDTAVFFNDLQRGDFQVGLADWIADYLDPTNFLSLFRADQSGSNWGGYNDPTYDGLMRRADAETDQEARARLLQAAERRMLQFAAIAPLYVNPSHNLVSPQVTGWYDNINDAHPARWMCLRPAA